eukprot:3927766-Heterocapsa_arctica.AAC.1
MASAASRAKGCWPFSRKKARASCWPAGKRNSASCPITSRKSSLPKTSSSGTTSGLRWPWRS